MKTEIDTVNQTLWLAPDSQEEQDLLKKLESALQLDINGPTVFFEGIADNLEHLVIDLSNQ